LGYLGNTDSAAAIYKGRTEKKDDYEREKGEMENICDLPGDTTLRSSKEAE